MFSCLILLTLFSTAQDTKQILEMSFQKCQTVKNGYFEMSRKIKNMTETDTFTSRFKCYFKKLDHDTIYPCAFHYTEFYKDKEKRSQILMRGKMYTGEDYVSVNVDSTAVVMSKKNLAKEIMAYRNKSTLYTPFTSSESSPIPSEMDFVDDQYTFLYIGDEIIKEKTCFHIRVFKIPEVIDSLAFKTSMVEYNFWINKADSIPIQYSERYDFIMNNINLHKYEKFVLNKYELNNFKYDSILTLRSIPASCNIIEYAQHATRDLLPINKKAPDWNLESTSGEILSLTGLGGQIVLIDFFYKGCYPCIKALPDLEAIHEKYKNKGVKLIGMDIGDKKEEMTDFVKKHGLKYTVLLGSEDIAKSYLVLGYPTIYIIGRNGKIIFSQAGYANNTRETLEEIIKKNL